MTTFITIHDTNQCNAGCKKKGSEVLCNLPSHLLPATCLIDLSIHQSGWSRAVLNRDGCSCIHEAHMNISEFKHYWKKFFRKLVLSARELKNETKKLFSVCYLEWRNVDKMIIVIGKERIKINVRLSTKWTELLIRRVIVLFLFFSHDNKWLLWLQERWLNGLKEQLKLHLVRFNVGNEVYSGQIWCSFVRMLGKKAPFYFT